VTKLSEAREDARAVLSVHTPAYELGGEQAPSTHSILFRLLLFIVGKVFDALRLRYLTAHLLDRQPVVRLRLPGQSYDNGRRAGRRRKEIQSPGDRLPSVTLRVSLTDGSPSICRHPERPPAKRCFLLLVPPFLGAD